MRMRTWTVGLLPTAILGTCAALTLGGYDALGLRTPLAPAFAQEHGQAIALVLRAGLLFAILVMPADASCATRRARTWGLASVGVLFLLSLVARGAVSFFILGALGDIAWFARRDDASSAPRVSWLAPAAGLLVLLVAVRGATPESTDPARSDARSLASMWRARGNLWRARWCALGWASHESPPGEAYVALAEANWELGRRDKARHVLAKVLAGQPPDAIRSHAEVMLQLWGP